MLAATFGMSRQGHVKSFQKLDSRLDRLICEECLQAGCDGSDNFTHVLTHFVSHQLRICELTPSTLVFGVDVLERLVDLLATDGKQARPSII